MAYVYRFAKGADQVVILGSGGSQPGVSIGTGDPGCFLPDDEIPNLISALQNYMTKRAREITRDAKCAVPRPEGAPRAEDAIRGGR